MKISLPSFGSMGILMLLASSGCDLNYPPSPKEADKRVYSADQSRKCRLTGWMEGLACDYTVEELLAYTGEPVGVRVLGYLGEDRDGLWLSALPCHSVVRDEASRRIAVSPTNATDFLEGREVLLGRGIDVVERNVGIFGVYSVGDKGEGILDARSIRYIVDNADGCDKKTEGDL